ncbi:formyltransferase family protein [Prochlorococcus marinus]|uniref:phosphoribosylglycinamide formyltransferase 1 n=1 Tax=Prochlorococcus marinus (strain MIT 9211) TaxID=93059 RepID=A9BBH0_PROM4|nr:formyltransferase family protein [Prochlorococcus marinus]ABX09182.1 Hypothetical protein P9211_12511 [Prochlorococcus marinus str. MIT 9211]|tara:strand:- start:167 stop:838 length:672 start_codon:yes stop_codon:yes gene_type:complete
MISKKVLFLGKKNDPYTLKALNHLRLLFSDVYSCLGEWGDKFPEEASWWDGDIIISYKSRWIVPKYLLEKSKEVAINFHPASPDFPGIGCINFALYEDAKEYGATCHHMVQKVDSGDIIQVSRFPVYPNDNVETLLTRTYDHQLCLFYEITHYLYTGKLLPKSDEEWTRAPIQRNDFNELTKIQIDMDKNEINKRIRATMFKDFRPELSLNGFIFELKNDGSK